MLFTTALTACLIPFVAAQYGYAPPGGGGSSSATPTATSTSPASAPSAPPSTTGQINVDVAAGGQFVFNPNNFTAPNGECSGTLVTFYFPNSAFAHSVSQSSFGAPCTYLASTNSTPAGFDSGLTTGTQFTIKITNDALPIWFHCKQVTHCGKGMVGSINAATSGNRTFDAFKAAALAIGSNEVTETDQGAVTGGVNAQATASPAAAGSAKPTTTTAASHSGATIGKTAGVGASLLSAALILIFA